MINDEEKIIAEKLFKILSCFLHDLPFDNNIDKIEFEKLYRLANIHKLTPILFYVMQEQIDDIKVQNEHITDLLKKEYRYALFNAVQQEESIEEMQSSFRKNSITLVFFKGAEIRAYYPMPQLRTMGDIDCLIPEKDRKKAHKLMLDMGYECNLSEGNVWTYNKNSVNIEIHTKIAENNIGNGFDYQKYFSDAINCCENINNALCLNKEYHLCLLIYHIAKHLSSTGAGIRMIYDVAVFLKHYEKELDNKKVKKMLTETHLMKTAKVIIALCDKWFETEFFSNHDYSQEIPEGLEEYIIRGGTFGFETHNTGDIYRRKALNQKEKKSILPYRIQVLKDYFFPSSDYLERYLPASKKYKWLLPAAWFCRLIVGVFKHGRHSAATLNSINNGDDERTIKEAQMLREMGL